MRLLCLLFTLSLAALLATPAFSQTTVADADRAVLAFGVTIDRLFGKRPSLFLVCTLLAFLYVGVLSLHFAAGYLGRWLFS